MMPRPREFESVAVLGILAAGWISACLAADSAPARSPAGAATVEVGLRKQLLVDDYVVAEKTGVCRRLGHVVKANGGKPIFDARFYGTVLYDENRFKMWLREPDGYGYAESSDGLRFEKKAQLTGINFAGDINLAVEINSHAKNPEHRFIAGYDAPGMAAGLAQSADGIRWTPFNEGRPVTFRAADCHNQVLWDEMAQTYRLFTRTDFGSGGGPLAGTAAADFEVRGTRGMTNPDILRGPTNWNVVRQWHFNREGPEEYRRRQIYSMTVWLYQGVYFALMSVYEYPADVSEGRTTDLVKRHERDVMNFYIATSRDADRWDLRWVYAGEPIIPRGPDGAFDKDIVFPSSTVVTHQDKHWLYYAGGNERHGTAELKPPVTFDRRFVIGLATLRLDGFVCLEAQGPSGNVITRPFVLQATRLEVNADASRGSIQVELLDAAGKPQPGYSGEDAVRLERVDGVRLKPRWRNHNDLSLLRGKTVRLRFHLHDAKLFAFQIQGDAR